ncbi:GTP-binding protein [Actinophytocola sediminis]
MSAIFCPVSGFLGAGKTTTLLAAARELRRRGHRPAIVTNDQGHNLVDTQLARTVTDAVGEVVAGCFCCRFAELAEVVTRLVDGGADVVLAEAVGSCTDLRATVVRPLRAHHGDAVRVAPLTAVVDPVRYRSFARVWAAGGDPDTGYLYAHQLAEADVLALNKLDLVGTGPLVAELARRYPSARVVGYSARSGAVGELVDHWLGEAETPDRPDYDLDYDRYAAAEAELAWLNHEMTVQDRFAPRDLGGGRVVDAVRVGVGGRDVGGARQGERVECRRADQGQPDRGRRRAERGRGRPGRGARRPADDQPADRLPAGGVGPGVRGRGGGGRPRVRGHQHRGLGRRGVRPRLPEADPPHPGFRKR